MWNDPELNINWPSNNPIVSEKDKNNYFIKHVLSTHGFFKTSLELLYKIIT